MADDEQSKDELLRELATLRRELAEARAANSAPVPTAESGPAHSSAERELRRQEQRLRLIVDGVRDHAISMLDAEGRILTFNPAAERIKGYALSEVQGQHFRLFFTPEDRADGMPETELQVARTQRRYEGEGFRQRKDGSRFYAAVSLSALYDSDGTLVGFVKVTQDRTRYRELSEALQRHEEQLRLILDGVRDHAISMLDAEGRILTLNASAERIKGYRLAEVAGQYFGLFFTAEDLEDGLPERELETARTTGRFIGEGWRKRKDGSRFYAMVSVSPLRGGDGALIGFVKVTQDITAQRRLAEEARSAREQAERERSRLKQMFDAMPAAIILLEGAALRCKFLSPAALEELGQPLDRVLGRPVAEVLGDAPEVLAAIQRTFADGETTQRVEVPITRDYGAGAETRHYTSAFIPLRGPRGEIDSVLVFSHNVTDQVRTRHAIQEANEKFQIVLEGVDDGITLQDPTGAIVYANEAAARTIGVGSVAELRETPAAELLARFVLLDGAGEPLPTERSPTHRAFRGERVTNELLRFRAIDTASERWSIVSSTPLLDAAGALRYVVNIFKDVTAERRAEAALRESERRFRAVFENALDAMIVTDDARRLLDANAAASELLGRSREELLQSEATSLVAPSKRDAAEALWNAFRAEGRQRGELEFVRADGTVRHVEYSATANFIPDRHLSVLRDVTERRAAEEAIRFLAEASTALAGSLDYQQTLATVAKLCVPFLADWAAVDMLGSDRALQRLAVVHADAAKVALAHDAWSRRHPSLDDLHGLGRVLRTGEPNVIWEISDATLAANIDDPELLSTYRELGLTSEIIVPLTLRGKAVGGITLATDSARRFGERDFMLAQELARRASVAIENATLYREAKDASQLKDEFLATVSHELRTPLTAVLGWATLVRTRQSDPAYVAKGLDTIERNARAQVQLIQDLLDISRVITGKLRLDVKAVDVSSVVETALDTVRPAVRAKSITLTHVLDPDASPVMGDPDRLLQIINNLLTNAVKFTPKNGHIRVYLCRVDSSAELVVRDTGEGIPSAFLPHVFERFRQAEAGLTRSRGGLGLGLAIARSLVELHGGTITAESPGAGQGATFTVRLPIAGLRAHSAVPSAAAGPPHETAGLDCPPELEGLRILVVDDEADTRTLLQVVLEQCKVCVETAASVAEALAQLQTARFDMLISDIGMPGEDGYSLIRRVRALPAEQGGHMPAMALTAYAAARDRTRALIAGYNVHLPKPVDPAELVVTVANQLGRFVRG